MEFFNQILSKHCGFLLQWGYKYSELYENEVAYIKTDVSIIFTYSSYSLELDCNITKGEHNIRIDELMEILQSPEQGYYQLGRASDMELGVKHVVTCLKKYCLEIVEQPVKFEFLCHEIEEKRQIELLQYQKALDFKKANAFWKQKRYQETKAIYLKYLNELNDIQ